MTPASIETIVWDIVRARASRLADSAVLPADVAIGGDGLGLDSIAIAEVLLDCEEHFGVSVISLLEGEPLTLTRLTNHLRASLQQETIA
jgi:acyl carrier protein